MFLFRRPAGNPAGPAGNSAVSLRAGVQKILTSSMVNLAKN